MALVPRSPGGSGPSTPSPSKRRAIDPSPIKQALQSMFESTSISEQSQETATETGVPIWSARHVNLPFDLRDPDVQIKDDVLETLLKIFPNTVNLARGISHLCFAVKEFPNGPLPLTVAGLPITMKNSHGRGRLSMFPEHMPGNMAIHICDGIKLNLDSLTCDNIRGLADRITRAILTQVPDLPITEVMLSAECRFSVVLKDHFKLDGNAQRRLPGKIAHRWTMYLNEGQLQRPMWSDQRAERLIHPNVATDIVDNTAYEVLRPAVLLHSKALRDHGHPAIYKTTSGVMVKNLANNVFMTASSHGIGEQKEVHQVQSSGAKRMVGKAAVEVSFTDVTLVQLEDNIRFVNELFEEPGRQQPTLNRLVGEVTNDPIRLGDITHFNSPYTGVMDGMVMYVSWRLPENSGHPTPSRLRYTIYNWTYVGQPENNPMSMPDGICGSAIWDDDGRVTGFFHYHIESGAFAGYYASVNADEVVLAEYRLSN